MGEALHFVRNKRTIILLLATVCVVGMFGMSLTSLMPAWAVDVLKGDVKTNGWLLSARGVGLPDWCLDRCSLQCQVRTGETMDCR